MTEIMMEAVSPISIGDESDLDRLCVRLMEIFDSDRVDVDQVHSISE